MLKIKLIILELYKQVTRYLFELEADEKRHTGVVTPHPELRQAVNKTWGAVWDSFEKLHWEENLKKKKITIISIYLIGIIIQNDDVPCRCD